MDGFPNIQVRQPGGESAGFTAFEGLNAEQQRVAEQMLAEARVADLYNSLAGAADAINALGCMMSGIESDDIIIDHDPATGRSQLLINKRAIADEISGDPLPPVAWEDRGRVLVVEVVDENAQTVRWAVGYPRSVAAGVQ